MATCLVESSKTCYFRLFSSSFYTTVVSDGLHEPYLLLTNSSFILILPDSYRGCLIWVKFVEIPEQKFERTLSLFSDKVRCFNQSERALYGNFKTEYIVLNRSTVRETQDYLPLQRQYRPSYKQPNKFPQLQNTKLSLLTVTFLAIQK